MKPTLLAVLAHPDDESFGPGGVFARYAAEGIDVHIAIATDGAAGSVVAGYEEARQQLAAVREKELEAAVAILGATLHTLDYRDSGYVNDPANEHPEAFIQAGEDEAIGRVVRLIREVRPQVVITHDETGGYFHPDHIFCSKITTAAFHAAGDSSRYPEIGPGPYRPQRLYYHAFPRRWIRLFNLLLRLRGKDPTKMGRNQDVDYTKLGTPAQKIHAYVDYRDYWEIKRAASAQHASQGGGISRDSLLPTWLQKRLFGIETFTRAFPPARDGYREKDLFAGITEAEVTATKM